MLYFANRTCLENVSLASSLHISIHITVSTNIISFLELSISRIISIISVSHIVSRITWFISLPTSRRHYFSVFNFLTFKTKLSRLLASASQLSPKGGCKAFGVPLLVFPWERMEKSKATSQSIRKDKPNSTNGIEMRWLLSVSLGQQERILWPEAVVHLYCWWGSSINRWWSLDLHLYNGGVQISCLYLNCSL